MSSSTMADHPPGRIACAMADPRFDRLRNRRARTRLSILHALMSAAYVAVLALAISGSWSRWSMVAVVGVGTVAWVGAMAALNASINGLTELGHHRLDEVQRRVRDGAYRRAYRGMSVLVAALACGVAFGWFDVTSATQDLVLGYGAFLAVLGLPAHLLAWTLPDDEDAAQGA